MKTRISKILVAIMALAVLASACSPDPSASSDALDRETQQADRVAERFTDSQPVPEFEWSQLRQNLIELLSAQARTTQTTSFFFTLGATAPIASCPSIGFPIPATYQLTNPERALGVNLKHSNGAAVDVAQMEATGVYTADTTGTYVMCVASNGQVYAKYWEGFVMSDTGLSEWRDGQIVLIGEPTFNFSDGR